MKPINAFEIKKSYRFFILNFLLLTICAILCIYLFFAASDREYALLEQKVQESEKLTSLRKEINLKFDIILMRFKELSQFRTYNADELSKQAILLGDITDANAKLKELISKKTMDSPSFELYERLNNDVGAMALQQDSLSESRFRIESYREQLNDCAKMNKAAANRIRYGRFRK
ncbi:hypothetical protein [Pedobacter jejuensis]|uniref:Type VI secretion system transmembrane protein TssO n=1 Tax=Pedobacter jejuensis TaxID=1268550 RepID=A0A3N0C2A4_9SPHI|nr:hypothetical protein [Pedobacter jejuensis]RNL55868.1 hypothetical protein D7004_03705 [Pedobacter jejuensis]